MNNLLKFPNSDDEEDLEALRLAALQSLKKPPHQENSQPFEQHSQTWHGKGFRNKRGKFFGAHARGGKIGHFARERGTTLISITTIDDQLKDKNPTEKPSSVNEESTSKFARYDKSDDSESESEEEVGSSEDDAPGKLERADSLEALMQELDDEIQGKSSVKERKEVKVKKVKKKKRVLESENKIPLDANVSQLNGSEEKKDAEVTLQSSVETTTSASSEVTKVENESEVTQATPTAPPVKMFNKKPLRSRSPVNRRGFYGRRKPRNFQMSQNPPPLMQFPPVQYAPPILPYPDQHSFNPQFVPAMNMVPQMQPIFYERPLSPLAINTESLTTATMAPLSPRSAAFVLENKAIIERRKRSPRRSYSRSISRSPRRSLTPRRSPRRSLSPRKSRSPRRLLPRKRSLSPRRKSLSPRRRSLSPKRRNIDRSNGGDSKAPLRDRLGIKNKSDESIKDSKTQEDNTKKDEKPLDPILEARKRKFETNEIKLKEGIIRLKPKEDKPKEEETKQEKVEAKVTETKPEAKVKIEKPKENIVEVAPATTTVEEKSLQKEKDLVPDEFKELEMLLNDEIMLEPEDIAESPKVDDIFSDEDSASDNEGRFKIKEQQSAKPPVLSYLKLVNGEKTEIKAEPLLLNTRIRHERNQRERSKRKIRSMTPPLKKSEPRKEEEKKKVTSTEKTSSKHKVSLKSDKRPPSMDKRFERKIEIKIKNPSKYERNSKSKVTKIEENIPSKVEKKLKMEKEESDNDEGFEPEIVIENDSDDDDDDEYLSLNEGDLRAQLSKKRAEKLHKIPVEGVPSRLLKFALQDTILKKKKKKSKDPESKLSSSDGRLPIHLRLGIASNSEIFAESRSKRKSRKRKNRELLEQV